MERLWKAIVAVLLHNFLAYNVYVMLRAYKLTYFQKTMFFRACRLGSHDQRWITVSLCARFLRCKGGQFQTHCTFVRPDYKYSSPAWTNCFPSQATNNTPDEQRPLSAGDTLSPWTSRKITFARECNMKRDATYLLSY